MENIFEYDFEVQYADIDSNNHLTDYAVLEKDMKKNQS